MRIQESGENYLEAILVLKNKNGSVRSIDIAGFLNFTKPSVSRAMTILKQAGHIIMDKDGQIQLTASGLAIAESIYEKHRFLTEFLIAIGVEEEIAAADACRIEHVISEQTFNKLKEKAPNLVTKRD